MQDPWQTVVDLIAVAADLIKAAATIAVLVTAKRGGGTPPSAGRPK